MSKSVGESAKNVQRLFEKAKENAPCTIFIDEIDSMCKKRSERGHEAYEQVKTQFLKEMDGIGSNLDGVFVLAATN